MINRGATAKLNQARSNILPQIFLTGCFLQERIETQNLGKDQALPAFPAVAALLIKKDFRIDKNDFRKTLRNNFVKI